MRPANPRIVPQVGDLADQPLARLVGRMGLAGEDDLDRPLRIVEHLVQPLEVGQDQVGPLVRGEAAGEADRQHVGIEQVAGHFDRLVALAAAAALPAHAAADELQQQVLQAVVRLPQLAGIDLVDLLPHVGLAHAARIQSAGKMRS